MLKVGFGRIDIVPREPVGLGGYGNGPHRMMTHILDPIFATCLAFTDETGETLLMISMDLICMEDVVMAALRENITAATGIPGDRIFAAATHTHYGPDVGNPGRPDVDEYIAYAAARTVIAVEQALENREEATVLGGTGLTENLNCVRHYIYGEVDGKRVPVGHQAEPDRRLHLLHFCRQEGHDILMMNWPAHPDCTGGGSATGLSADYIGPLRSILEAQTNCQFVFFQGAGGNLVPYSKVDPPQFKGYTSVHYGGQLANVVLDLLPRLQPVKTGPIKVLQRAYNCPYDHSTDAQVPEAKELWEHWLKTGDFDTCRQWAKKLGYGSWYQARAILMRAEAPRYLPLELNVATIGDLAFATAPCEMFDTAGAYVIDNSPCPNTMMLAYCNDSRGYFPNHNAFRYGCYEVDTHVFSEGSAEEMAETLVDMLKTL